MGPGGPGPPGWGPAPPGGPGGWGPAPPGGPGGWGPGGPGGWGPAPFGPSGLPGFFGGFCDIIGSCLSCLCCCWLIRDCFGGPFGPPGPRGPFGP